MLLILLCWLTMSEAYVGGMAVRGLTFPPILCYILLLGDKWQRRGSQTKWHLT